MQRSRRSDRSSSGRRRCRDCFSRKMTLGLYREQWPTFISRRALSEALAVSSEVKQGCRPLADDTATNAIKTQLVTALLEEVLTEYTYDAALAGLHYSVGSSSQGVQIYTSGYSEKLHVLLRVVVERLVRLDFPMKTFSLVSDRVRSMRVRLQARADEMSAAQARVRERKAQQPVCSGRQSSATGGQPDSVGLGRSPRRASAGHGRPSQDSRPTVTRVFADRRLCPRQHAQRRLSQL